MVTPLELEKGIRNGIPFITQEARAVGARV